MDYLHLDRVCFKGKHGYFDHERIAEQTFVVSVRLGVDCRDAGTSDDLADAVDYQEIKNKIQKIIEGPSCYLIEKLAEDIAATILEDRRIRSVEVTINKPEVWDKGIPGVTINRP